MNNKEGNNKRGGSRPNSSRSNSSKPKPPMAKRAQGPKKVNPAVKAAEEEKAAKLKKQNQAPKRQKASDEIRLNKYISNSGVCSRRDADIYIQSGNVKVNGVPVTEMGYLVKLNDVVNFDGVVLTPEKKEYILLNKPKNFTTALDEGQEYRNVLELVRGSTTSKIAPIGRMDKNTTGLLLFTNDTDMIRKFTLPSQKSSKIYQEVDFTSGRILSVDDCYRLEGNDLLKEIFTNKKGRISEMISNEVGIKSETAREILNFSALLVISYLKNNAQLLESLKLLLDDQKRDILNSIPPGIKIILGFSCYETVEEKNQSIGRSIFTLFGHNFFSF